MSQAGDNIPQGTFDYIPFTPELEDDSVCGVKQTISTDDWKDKKVVLVGVPGAFTPTCHQSHAPEYVKKVRELKDKGADIVAVIMSNDAYVASAWGRTLKAKGDVLFLADNNGKWAEQAGLTYDASLTQGFTRLKRFAAVIDQGVFKILEVETKGGVSNSGADYILSQSW
ncbi:hypothetical protein PROFUN_07424 [Planoprotostelium fungivorum]|uniref:Thioredoxin domain-containing protein n=1 Tax=Planoprotostelium fungivorum TaxID=1890364 RepID=A0A2P6NLD2_9EUKA|nr:hypothetical protein PROFUN_07424 [Planoprotostelium fungivorum]